MEASRVRNTPRRQRMLDTSPTRRIGRSTSNMSSTSSDIQVATTSQQQPTTGSSRTAPSTSHVGLRRRPVSASVKRHVLIVRNLLPTHFPIDKPTALDLTTNNNVEMANPAMPYDDLEGPNHRGTYSKEFTLRHPEYTWVHRGQGRWLPSGSVKKLQTVKQSSGAPTAIETTSNSLPSTSLHPNGSTATSQNLNIINATGGQQDQGHGRNGVPSGKSQPVQLPSSRKRKNPPEDADRVEVGDSTMDQPRQKRTRATEPASSTAMLSSLNGMPDNNHATLQRKRTAAAMSGPELSQRPSRRQRLPDADGGTMVSPDAIDDDTSTAGRFVDERKMVRASELTAAEKYHIPRRQAWLDANATNDQQQESDEWEGFSDGDGQSEAIEDADDADFTEDDDHGATRAGARRSTFTNKAGPPATARATIPRSSTKVGASNNSALQTLPQQQLPALSTSNLVAGADSDDGHLNAEEDSDQDDHIENLPDDADGHPLGSPGVSTDPGGVKTFTKETVAEIQAQHPWQQFYHTGNGWYKKGSRGKNKLNPGRSMQVDDDETSGPATTSTSRTRGGQNPTSSALHGATTTAAPAAVPTTSSDAEDPRAKTYRKTEIALHFPGEKYHHVGNGWFRVGPAPVRNGSQSVSTALPQPKLDSRGTADKAETERYPHIEWVHRGNGRYRPRDQVDKINAPAPAVTTVSRRARGSAAESDASQRQTVRRGSDRTRGAQVSTDLFVNDEEDEISGGPDGNDQLNDEELDHEQDEDEGVAAVDEMVPSSTLPGESGGTLYSKEYVDAHPHLEFHHRGQGRYAAGPRPPPPSKGPAITPIPSLLSEPQLSADPNKKYPTTFVDKHPEITFHHKGQGRWMQGFPPRDAPNFNKIAIRGPGAALREQYLAQVPAKKPALEEDLVDSTAPVPGLLTLLVKAETEKWKQFKWYYIGGAKYSRSEKSEYDRLKAIEKRKEVEEKNSLLGRGKPKRSGRGYGEGPEAQLEREAEEAERNTMDTEDDLVQPPKKRQRPALSTRNSLRARDGMPKVASRSKTTTPKPPMMNPEDDIINEDELPSFYTDEWFPPSLDEPIDDADDYMRANYRPTAGADLLIESLERFDPTVRPTSNLYLLAANAATELEKMQDEYLRIDRFTAANSKISRKPAKGGRVPINSKVYEDIRESNIYDYEFNRSRIGFQDPIGQKVLRDADGRELRKRRTRGPPGEQGDTEDGTGVVSRQIGMFGQQEDIVGKRPVKPVNRFDGVVADAGRKRKRGENGGGSGASTPAPMGVMARAKDVVKERSAVPATDGAAVAGEPQPLVLGDFVAPVKGRWKNHITKAAIKANRRVEDLKKQNEMAAGIAAGGVHSAPGGTPGADSTMRDGSGTPAPTPTPALGTQGQRSATPGGTTARKGRPPGSKNLGRRSDYGIPKGPRKPKKPEGEAEVGVSMDGAARMDVVGNGEQQNGGNGAVVDTIEG